MVMKYKGLTLDPFQENSINAIEKNFSVVVSAPTGSGKTLIADYIINKHKDDEHKIIYTAPIKALSNQKYKDFSEEYGEKNVGLMTGDIVINPTAKVLIMTTEIYRNMVMVNDESVKDVVYVIFDEVHYINDIERGYVWEESIIYSPKTVRFLCLSATIPNAEEFSKWISAIKKHEVKTVTSDFRVVPLSHAFYDYELGITNLISIKKRIEETKDMPHYGKVMRRGRGKKRRIVTPKPDHVKLIKSLGSEKLPCLFFSFSRKDCQQKAKELTQSNIFMSDSKIVSYVSKAMREWPSEIGKLASTIVLKRSLPRGIGFHHAGLLPIVKELVEDLFSQGLIKVLYTTETFAVGINMPAKTVCFNSLRKFDGISFRNLNTKEYFQIAGRAGRRGIDTHGYVVSMINRHQFNYKEIKKLTYKDVEPIHSQFKLGVNTTLNLINQHTPDEIEMLLRQSFYSYQKFGEEYEQVPTEKLLFRYNRIRKRLKKYGFLDENGKLTAKGKFGTRIFANELIISEVFSGEEFEQLSEYQILLLLAALVYEPRERTIIKKTFPSKELQALKKFLNGNEVTRKNKKFESLNDITAFVWPIYNGKTFFDVLELTSLLEGDMIRFYGQILDRIGQIRKAGVNSKIIMVMDNCQGVILNGMEGIYLV
jgi:superfamily II RNA helicase